MSAPIGPGDRVRCIRSYVGRDPHCAGVIAGREYVVTRVGLGALKGTPICAVRDAFGTPYGHGRKGLHLAMFRLIGPGDADLIQHLLQPAPERERELSDA